MGCGGLVPVPRRDMIYAFYEDPDASYADEGQAHPHPKALHPSTSSTPCPYRTGRSMRQILRFAVKFHQKGKEPLRCSQPSTTSSSASTISTERRRSSGKNWACWQAAVAFIPPGEPLTVSS